MQLALYTQKSTITNIELISLEVNLNLIKIALFFKNFL